MLEPIAKSNVLMLNE